MNLEELQKSLNMTVKPTTENTALLCEIHIETAQELLRDSFKDGELNEAMIDVINNLLQESLDFIYACQDLMKAQSKGVSDV